MRRSNVKPDLRVLNFIEDLSRLIYGYSDLNFRQIPQMLELRNHTVHSQGVLNYASDNPNKHFLSGALPRILTDTYLFPTNDHIALFAESVLDIVILRSHKKSKYEIIGHIVCNIDSLDDQKLNKLVNALAIITKNNGDSKKNIRLKLDNNYGWNDIIQDIIDEDNTDENLIS